jgi:hypothetical protein
MAYTALPPVPNRPTGSPEQFSQAVYLFMNSLPNFGVEMQDLHDDTETQNNTAKAWATQLTTEVVTGQGYSSRQYAINSGESATLSNKWATYLSGEVVTGQGYSAKYYSQASATSATLSNKWASKTGETVADSEYSAKEYAQGSLVESSKRHASGIVSTGSAKSWAVQLTTEVVTGQGYSAKQYALNASGSAILSSDWATKTGSKVANSEYSSKEYAQGNTVESAKRHASGTVLTGSSKDWATLLGSEVVIGQGYSAKHYAQVAQAAVAELPDGTINDSIVSAVDAWSSQNLNHIVTASESMAESNNETADYINGLFGA